MSKKVLSVIDNAYRACQEEQDDAGLWFSAAVKNAGVELTILLTGNAVNYAVKGHKSDAFSVGGGTIADPFDPAKDLERAAGKGIGIYMVREDADERGIEKDSLIGCVEQISRSKIAELVENHDDIWHW